MERINERIKRLRDKAGMSQAALARAVGVSRPAVTKWENGDTENLKLANLIKLCQIFRMSADDMISGELSLPRSPVMTNEPATPYRVNSGYQLPEQLMARCAALTDDGRRLVEAQLDVAIETAQRMYGSRDASQQNAA